MIIIWGQFVAEIYETRRWSWYLLDMPHIYGWFFEQVSALGILLLRDHPPLPGNFFSLFYYNLIFHVNEYHTIASASGTVVISMILPELIGFCVNNLW